MAKEINWNTVLIVLIVGIVGILVLSNSGVLTGFLTSSGTTKEIVTCNFVGSKNEEKCYSEKWSCKGQSSCDVVVSGTNGQKIEWKSSCGGYAYTIIDGKDEKALFVCLPLATEVKANSCDADNTCEAKALQVKDLAGEGTNYVCADNKGILFNSPLPCVQETPKCFDSDGGLNYYLKGTVSTPEGSVTDSCGAGPLNKGGQLLEWRFDEREGEGPCKLDEEYYTCPNGCKDGACNKKLFG